MKKILLIEDRDTRQRLFENETGIDLEKYNDFLDNCIADKCDAFLDGVISGSFDFDPYDMIISHKSAFEDRNTIVLKAIEDHCKDHAKPLVLFSGGIVGSYYNRDEYEILELNSKTFYSQNLVLFLDACKDNSENILMLSYGANWKLNIIMKVVEDLNLYIDTKDDLMLEYVDLDRLKQINIDCEMIDMHDDIGKMIHFKDCLVDVVEELADA